MAHTTPDRGIIDKTPELKAFTNARIVVSPENTIEDAVLVIDKGKVVKVGTNINVPAGATVIDLSGKTIYPGFVEPYTEYGLKSIPEPKRERRRGQPPIYDAIRIGGNAWNGAIHAEQNWVDMFQPDSKASESFIELGYTTVQSANLDGIFRGRSFVTSLGEGLPNDLVIRPYSWHFLSFDKGNSKQEYPESQMGAIALIRQTLLDLEWYRHSKTEFNAAMEALETINTAHSERVVFATPDKLAMLRADLIAREFALNIQLLGCGQEFERMAEIKATGRPIILPVNFAEAPELKTFGDEIDVSLTALRRWDWEPSNPALLDENGVRFAFTTHGLKDKGDLMPNIRRAIKRGLSKKMALAALTIIPAQLCGVDGQVGSIKGGKLADFIVTNGDLFDKKTQIFAVYTNGQKHEYIPFDKTDFGGYFVGLIDDHEVGLKFKDEGFGDKREVSGVFKSGKTKIDLNSVSVAANQITFSASLDDLGLRGVARFALRKKGDDLAGRVALADGSWLAWNATKGEEPIEPADESDSATTDSTDAKSPDDEADKAEEEDAALPDTVIARLTYPNMGLGVETLPQPENVLVKNGTVWTSEDAGILENTDLLIKDGRIEAIGKDLSAPSGYRVIDAAGKHVTAGVVDEHSHVCITGDVNEGTEAITSEVRIPDVIRSDDVAMYRSLAGGCTTTRTIHGSANPIGGQAQILKFRWGSPPEAMKFAEAPPSIKFALGENVKQSNWGDNMTTRYPQTRMGVETIIRDAFQAAKEYEDDWAVYNALGKREREKTVPPRRNLRLEALVDVLNEQMYITCHAYVQTEILMLMRLAEDFGFTIRTFIHILEGYKVADEMARHGAMGASIPDWWAYKFEVYDAIPHGPGIMNEHGVVVSINSDSQNLQRRLNQEAAKSVMYAGMSQEDAWKMVTINPAIQLKAEDVIGSLKVGKHADFVIWNGNPLSIYSHPEQTWVDGTKYFDIDDDLARRASIAEEKSKLIQKILDRPSKKGKKKGDGKKGRRGRRPGVLDQEGVSHEAAN